MIFFLIVVGLGALMLLAENAFLHNQNHELIKERNAAQALLAYLVTSGTQGRILREVVAERRRQIQKGWTPEHDDRHTTNTMVLLSEERIRSPRRGMPYTRAGLVQGVAILIAAIESMDRRAAARAEADR